MSHVIMNAVIGFPARVDIVSAAMSESDISDKLRMLWPGIASRLLKKYRSRHEAAHFLLENVEQEDGSYKALLTPFATTIGSYSNKRLSRSDLDAKTATFSELRSALLWFRGELEIERERDTIPVKPIPPLILRVIQSLENQILREPE